MEDIANTDFTNGVMLKEDGSSSPSFKDMLLKRSGEGGVASGVQLSAQLNNRAAKLLGNLTKELKHSRDEEVVLVSHGYLSTLVMKNYFLKVGFFGGTALDRRFIEAPQLIHLSNICI